MGSSGENEHILVAMSAGVYNVQKATCGNNYCQTCQGAVNSWISPSPSVVQKGSTANATFTVQYKSGTQYNHTSIATWSSTNTAIATVSAGTVTGKGVGSANLDALDSNVWDYSYTCYSSNPDSVCPTVTGQEGSAPEQTKAVPVVTVYTGGNIPYGHYPGDGNYSEINATVSPNLSPIPTGNVTFSGAAQATSPNIALDAKAAASWDIRGLGTGPLIPVADYNVSVQYLGDNNYDPADGSSPLNIIPAPSLSVITNCNGSMKAGTATFTATVGWLESPTSTGTSEPLFGLVMLAALPISGGNAITTPKYGLGSNAGGPSKVSIPITLPVGKFAVTAEYQGETNYEPSNSPECIVTVN